MSQSFRFLGLAVGLWVAGRITTAEFADAGALTSLPRPAGLTQVSAPVLADLPPLDPPAALSPPPPLAYFPLVIPVRWERSRPVAAATYALADPAPGWSLEPSIGYGHTRPLREWPIERLASSGGASSSTPPWPVQSARPFDRLQLTTWAMVRADRGLASSSSLAAGGLLGGSQGGARLLYRVNPRLAGSLRLTAPIGGRTTGGEAALGIRVQPWLSVPVALTAERRQAIGKGGGRSDLALFAEGGVWDRPLPGRFLLDGYVQAGVVGVSHHDLFAEGSAVATRQFLHRFWAGVGVWGGAQSGTTRLDVGPRLSIRPRRNLRLHLDYRQEVAGSARPGSGPVVTLAGDF